jgi:2'-5' RNA ligase
MRLFIACEAIGEIHDELVELQKKLPSARMTFPQHFHLTLKFLGDVSKEKADEVKHRLEKIEFFPFELCLQPLEVFDPNNVRVVWASVNPEEPLNILAQQVDKVLLDLFPPNDKFKPHLTIARVKALTNREEFIKQVQSLDVKGICFTINKFYLIESKLTPKGPEYTILRAYESE